MEQYRDLECEANAQGTHHVHQVRGYTRDMVEQAIHENYQLLDEMEPGQYLWVFPFWHIPCNTLR